jgi:ABC-2 type transport system ATP-binding protein
MSQTTSSPVLEAEGLVKQFPGVRAVDGVGFALDAGTCFGLLGPNGAGKTTTVEMLEGITEPTAGAIRFRGAPRGAEFRARAGIQFQKTALPDFMTVREALAMFSRFYPRAMDLDTLIGMCALEGFLHQYCNRVSGGQRQRLLLAIALVNDPDIVFLDEPTTGLDPQARRNFWSLVETIRGQGKTILLTTHYMEEAARLCDRIAIVDHGRIIAEGAPGDLLSAHFGDTVLDVPRADLPDGLPAVPGTWVDAGERLEILTRDVRGSIDALLHGGARLERLRIRERTLEDLFLELTGRDLRS